MVDMTGLIFYMQQSVYVLTALAVFDTVAIIYLLLAKRKESN
jgi:hypothetical protein